MATFNSSTDKKQMSVILNLIKLDCNDLYKNFHYKKTTLKQAIEEYEEFMVHEINSLFNDNNNFSGIVIGHRNNFQKFFNDFRPVQVDLEPLENGNTVKVNGLDESVYAMCISVQEWLLQGAKGQQFYFLINIDAFNLTKQAALMRNTRTNVSKNVSFKQIHLISKMRKHSIFLIKYRFPISISI